MHILVLILEWLFFMGLAGSMVVAVWAFIADCFDFFEKGRPESSQAIGD
jgi:hypothetical protein